MARITRAKVYDFAATLPLILCYGIGIAGLCVRLAADSAALRDSFTATGLLNAVYESGTIVFLTLLMSLFVFRRVPTNGAKGVLPRAAAILGANIQFLFLLLPRVENSFPILLASTLVTLAGLFGSIYAASFLGRSFSIMPQARKLVTAGPYRLVRHPLYLAEQIALFGIMWQFAQPFAFLIVITGFAIQFVRMHYEEQVLAETYPAYRAYMRTTGRILPRIASRDTRTVRDRAAAWQ